MPREAGCRERPASDEAISIWRAALVRLLRFARNDSGTLSLKQFRSKRILVEIRYCLRFHPMKLSVDRRRPLLGALA